MLHLSRCHWQRAVGALLALAAALGVARGLDSRLRALTALEPVVVAQTVIPPYTPITAAMVTVTKLPRRALAQPVYAEPAAVLGQVTQQEILPGVPLWRAWVLAPAALRYTADAAAVIVGIPVARGHVPGALLQPGQRVDVWQGAELIGPGLRIVALTPEGPDRLIVSLESSQALLPALLRAAADAETTLTLAPLTRAATPTPTATPTAPITVTPTWTAPPTATPGVVTVKPGPAQGLNIRAGPGTDAPVLVTLPAGSRLTPVGRDTTGRWVQVCCVAGGQSGWVRAELVDLAGDLQSLPVR